jgi:hypothetical protein
MSSQIFLYCIHNAKQPQARNRRYPSFVTTWTNIALVKFYHPEQFPSLIISMFVTAISASGNAKAKAKRRPPAK